MAIPDYQTLMLPVLRHAAQSETRVPDVETKIADEFELTPEERDQLLPSGRQRVLHNRIHWAKFYMQRAGLVDFPRRGRFIATEKGKELLATNPTRIDVETLLQYPSFQEFYRGGGSDANEERSASVTSSTPKQADKTPEEQIESAQLACNPHSEKSSYSGSCRTAPTSSSR